MQALAELLVVVAVCVVWMAVFFLAGVAGLYALL